jgi:hypothetical protein
MAEQAQADATQSRPYPRQLEADWILALLEGLYENSSAG